MPETHDRMHEPSERMLGFIAEAGLKPFWDREGHALPLFSSLEEGLKVPVATGESVQTGRLAATVDLWVASEFERAGFEGLWPRLSEPRAIDPEVLRAVRALPARDAAVGARMVARAGTADANVMGSAYVKQVDVGLSSWLGGPELLVSTKTMSGSFGKNLANRFEEAYGDVKNLRARYPLAAHGFLFMVHASIARDRGAFDKAVHMLRQLSRGGDVYDAVCLLIAGWDSGTSHVLVPAAQQELVPQELQPAHFFEELVRIILANAPIDRHVRARELYPGLT